MFITDIHDISTNREYTDEGYLRVPANISRIGVQLYTAIEMGKVGASPDELVNIYRPADEVFTDESLASFINKPITNNHPPTLLDAKTAAKYSVGMSIDKIRRNHSYVRATLLITDAAAIREIENGKVELSNGYTSDIEWVAGVTDGGESYEGIQRNIRGNHIAIVAHGRAGKTCKISDKSIPQGDEMTIKISVKDVSYDVEPQIGQLISSIQNDAKMSKDAVEKELEDLKGEMDNMKEKMAKLRAMKDDLEEKKTTDAQLDVLVADRQVFVDQVLKINADTKWQGLVKADIIKSVVTDALPKLDLKDQTAEYLQARFDILVENSASKPVVNLVDVGLSATLAAPTVKVVDTRPISVIAREKMIHDSRNAWKSVK